MSKIIQIISPMWPSNKDPYYGIFVKRTIEGLINNGWGVRNNIVIKGRANTLFSKIKNHMCFGISIIYGVFLRSDIVYVHSPSWFSILIILYKWIGSKRIVINLHGGEILGKSYATQLNLPFVKFLCHKADMIVVPSNFFKMKVSESLEIDNKNIYVYPSAGVDINASLRKDKYSIPFSQKTYHKEHVIGYVGRLDPGKGWEMTLNVLQQLREENINVKLIVIGSGKDSKLFNTEIVARGLENVVTWIKGVEHLYLKKMYMNMDILIFPSQLPESLGLVPIEALASGIPVISSDVGATSEYILNGQNGWLCDKDAVDCFVLSIREILKYDTKQRLKISEKCRRSVEVYDSTLVNEKLALKLEYIMVRG